MALIDRWLCLKKKRQHVPICVVNAVSHSAIRQHVPICVVKAVSHSAIRQYVPTCVFNVVCAQVRSLGNADVFTETNSTPKCRVRVWSGNYQHKYVHLGTQMCLQKRTVQLRAEYESDMEIISTSTLTWERRCVCRNEQYSGVRSTSLTLARKMSV